MYYLLSYIDECGNEVEKDIEAESPDDAKAKAFTFIRGGEGLIDCITMSSGAGDLYEYDYASCEWTD